MAPINKPKIVVATVATILLFIGFNAYQPSLENIQEAEFNSWYEETITKRTAKPQLQGDTTPSAVAVSIIVNEIQSKNVIAQWNIPRTHVASSSDYDMLLRVLQLIKESNLFHLKPVTRSSGKEFSVSITVKTPQQSFQTTISMQAVEESIQLRNLLKLLETHDSLPPPQTVYPTSRL